SLVICYWVEYHNVDNRSGLHRFARIPVHILLLEACRGGGSRRIERSCFPQSYMPRTPLPNRATPSASPRSPFERSTPKIEKSQKRTDHFPLILSVPASSRAPYVCNRTDPP